MLKLPVLNPGERWGGDPFGFARNLANYVSEYEGMTAYLSKLAEKAQATIGGDYLEVTSWTSEERKKHSFRGKDLLVEEAIKAIKKGNVLMMKRRWARLEYR